MTPTFYIGGSNGTALVEGPLLALGWKRTTDKTDERFRMKWTECKSYINYATFREGDQIVNHIPNGQRLTNKLGLLCSLQEYERVTLSTKGRLPRLRMTDFFPETYRLDDKGDRNTFLGLYEDGETWICKPVGLNQGKGIFLLRSREEIDQLLDEREARKEANRIAIRPPMMRLVQRYIPNPLLLEGRKFDIRAYMLIGSTVPYLVLFHHGYIRLSCQQYDSNDTNLTTHLTNQYIQKKDPSYQQVKEDTAWSMAKFNDYINTHYAAEKGIEQDWTFRTLTRQMQRIILHCFNSVKNKLQCKVGFFDLYGLDFMIDAHMKVWLIEINVNPSLTINCEALKAVIPGVVEESIYIAIEAFDKTRRNQPILPLQSLKGFQMLHCGSSLFSVRIPRQSRSVSPGKRERSPVSPERTAPHRQSSPGRSRRCLSPRTLPRMSRSPTSQVTPSSSFPPAQKRRVSSEGGPVAPTEKGRAGGGPKGSATTAAAVAVAQSPPSHPHLYSAPSSLPPMKLFHPAVSSFHSSHQISPYLRSSQGGNPGGFVTRSSQPSLPSIPHPTPSHHPASKASTTTTTTTINQDQPAPSTITISFPNHNNSNSNNSSNSNNKNSSSNNKNSSSNSNNKNSSSNNSNSNNNSNSMRNRRNVEQQTETKGEGRKEGEEVEKEEGGTILVSSASRTRAHSATSSHRRRDKSDRGN